MNTQNFLGSYEVINQAEDWLFNKALPHWASKSPSPEGGFYERHTLNGEGIPHEDSRVRLQARQTYCFALAASIGWEPNLSQSLVERGLNVLIQDCQRMDGLYGKRVKPGYGLSDDTAETYDCAFALLAFATSWHFLKIEKALQAGQNLITAMETKLKRSFKNGGYAERLPVPTRREQNPHMHLCEASLAWFEATGDKRSLERAYKIVQFVEVTFWDDERQVLREFDVTAQENHIQIGHMFEWVWILHRMSKLSAQPLLPLAYKLYQSAVNLASKTHFLPLSSYLDGEVREAKQRTWTLAEALKAHIAMADSSSSKTISKIIPQAVISIFNDHLDNPIEGAWIDIRSAEGLPLTEDITPATGYHIFTAFADLIAFKHTLS